MLHSGHVAFFKEAARYGDLYVGIGADSTIEQLKTARRSTLKRTSLHGEIHTLRYRSYTSTPDQA